MNYVPSCICVEIWLFIVARRDKQTGKGERENAPTKRNPEGKIPSQAIQEMENPATDTE